MPIGVASSNAGDRNVDIRPAWKVVGALKSLSAKGTTGAGTAFDLGGAFKDFAVQCSIAGSTSATVQLQGSIDGTNYKTLGANVTVDSTANNAITRSTNSTPVTHVRLNISALTTSGTATVEAISGWISVL